MTVVNAFHACLPAPFHARNVLNGERTVSVAFGCGLACEARQVASDFAGL
jgi:hypothetical protein